MPKIPSKMHMYDMVKIETIVFEIVGENLKHPDGIGLSTTTNTLRKHIIMQLEYFCFSIKIAILKYI